MLAIKNNLMAEGAARHLGTSYDALAQSVQRLSSGLRINSAKDDGRAGRTGVDPCGRCGTPAGGPQRPRCDLNAPGR